jgi:rare lipoprotein A
MRSALVIFPQTYHAALLALVLVAACAGPGTNRVPSLGESIEIRASYYSRAFAGRKTASGEPYDPKLLTAAHANLPMGTILRVTRLPGGPSVEVRVNDRCGCTHGRQLDLSEAAARRLDMLRVGVAQVRIEVVGRRPAR